MEYTSQVNEMEQDNVFAEVEDLPIIEEQDEQQQETTEEDKVEDLPTIEEQDEQQQEKTEEDKDQPTDDNTPKPMSDVISKYKERDDVKIDSHGHYDPEQRAAIIKLFDEEPSRAIREEKLKEMGIPRKYINVYLMWRRYKVASDGAKHTSFTDAEKEATLAVFSEIKSKNLRMEAMSELGFGEGTYKRYYHKYRELAGLTNKPSSGGKKRGRKEIGDSVDNDKNAKRVLVQ